MSAAEPVNAGDAPPPAGSKVNTCEVAPSIATKVAAAIELSVISGTVML